MIDRPGLNQYSSIWDTGATISMISERVFAELGLQPEGYTNIHYADGAARDVPVFHVDLLLYNNVQERASRECSRRLGAYAKR